jgi:hypothetical protein
MVVDFDYILDGNKKVVKVFSINYFIEKIIECNSFNKNQKGKLKNYLDNFYFNHKDLEYYRCKKSNKILIDIKYLNKIKNELSNLMNNKIKFPYFKPKELNKYEKLEIEKIINLEKQKRDLKKIKQFERIKDLNNELNELFNLIKNNRKIIIFDMEFWEKDMYKILEVSFGKIRFKNEKINFEELQHFIIKENINLKNYLYVKDNKFNIKTDYKPKIQVINLDDFLNLFKNILVDIDALIIHGPENDLKVLKKYGITIDKKIFDTSKLGVIIDKKYIKNQRIGLDSVAKFLGKDEKDLHNATNDVSLILDLLEYLKRRKTNGKQKRY